MAMQNTEGLESKLKVVLNIVNNPFKSLTMLVLDNIPMRICGIVKQVREFVGEDTYLPDVASFREYCQGILSKLGVVEEEGGCFRSTEFYKEHIEPAIYFTIEYIGKSKTSMFDVLGPSQSSGKKRAPYTRIRILEALRVGKQSISDLTSNLDLTPSSLRQHLKALKKYGFISYDSCGELLGEKREFVYEPVEGKSVDDVTPINNCLRGARRVARKLITSGSSSYHSLARSLKISPSYASVILSGLAKQGVIRRKRWRTRECLSEVCLLEEGEKFLGQYSEKIRNALSNDIELKRMKLEMQNQDPEKFRATMRRDIARYKRTSEHINARPIIETQVEIIEYLEKNPGARPTEMSKALGIPYLRKYLTPLIKARRVRRIKRGKEAKYFTTK